MSRCGGELGGAGRSWSAGFDSKEPVFFRDVTNRKSSVVDKPTRTIVWAIDVMIGQGESEHARTFMLTSRS